MRFLFLSVTRFDVYQVYPAVYLIRKAKSNAIDKT